MLAQTRNPLIIKAWLLIEDQSPRIASDTSACIWHAKVLIMPGFYLPRVESRKKRGSFDPGMPEHEPKCF